MTSNGKEKKGLKEHGSDECVYVPGSTLARLCVCKNIAHEGEGGEREMRVVM